MEYTIRFSRFSRAGYIDIRFIFMYNIIDILYATGTRTFFVLCESNIDVLRAACWDRIYIIK